MSRALPRLACVAAACLATAGVLRAQSAPPVTRTSPPSTKPSGPPPAPKLDGTYEKLPTTFEGVFAERRARAEGVRAYLRCMDASAAVVLKGSAGSIPTTWQLACAQLGGEWRGILTEPSGGGVAVRAQLAANRLSPIVRDPIDTARAAAVAKSYARALAVRRPTAPNAAFLPAILPQSNYVEIWFLPVQTPASVFVGGDSVIQMAPDGSREFGHTGRAPTLRTLPAPTPDMTRYVIESGEARVPLVSELLAAQSLLGRVPEVQVVTQEFESLLTKSGWTHRRRRGSAR